MAAIFSINTIKTILSNLLHIMTKDGATPQLLAPTATNNYIQINDDARFGIYHIDFIDETLGKSFDATFDTQGLTATITYKTVYYDGTHELRLSNISGNIYALKIFSNGTEVTMNVNIAYLNGLKYTAAY